MHQEKTNHFYNHYSEFFDHIPFDKILPSLLQKYKIGNKVLEVGSGAGALAEWLTQQGCLVTCVEPAEKLAYKARNRGLKVIQTTIQDFQTEESFDSVIAISSLIHVPKEEFPIQIEKLRKILVPNGLFFVSLIEGTGEGLEDPADVGKERYFAKWTKEELAIVLSSFELIEDHHIPVKRMKCDFILRVYKKPLN